MAIKKLMGAIRFWPSDGLQPCPRCKGKPVMASNRKSATFDQFVLCGNCGLEGPHDDSLGGARNLWNEQTNA
jgi:hypothetical protein